MRYPSRAVDHEGEVLQSFVTVTRNQVAALTFMRQALKRHGSPCDHHDRWPTIYKAAMNELGNAERQEVCLWANNGSRTRTYHSDDEGAMSRFRQMKTLQKLASVHA
ncbi:DDE-type integrase/transposase/recombinase [Sphingomonas sp. R86521]|uniref:DDE-type integrase/transposase/recombinase n=1 Tax=Sphingomonas sp. R86521 TaxID=3093860 RepID=UPI0036D3E22E